LAALQRLHPINMRRIPDSVKDPLERMLALEPAHRPEAIALTQVLSYIIYIILYH
jgi:hypothetical protein